MSKRRSEDTLIHDCPSKKSCLSPRSVDLQLGSIMAPSSGGVSPPSLLALLGGRCRKRQHYLEEVEETEDEVSLYLRPTHHEVRRHAAHVLTVQTPGSFHERRSSGALTSSKKRAREERAGPETDLPTNADKADKEVNAEDCAYNSFQYWRVPLPALDLSLLQDNADQSETQNKTKVKDISSDCMET
ncbi:uncharacterized protein wu:fa19b12 [Xyrichtys novacula]|uniref:Uncharacterized protein wu:fa19b12 n=1 Tax=Xyrichtys novacula TaxID=13765 RepID=A0AAV1G4J7_XYRNO|nr:uncharacterized protein wu:fa19b12 [Xyrichtys novacula]